MIFCGDLSSVPLRVRSLRPDLFNGHTCRPAISQSPHPALCNVASHFLNCERESHGPGKGAKIFAEQALIIFSQEGEGLDSLSKRKRHKSLPLMRVWSATYNTVVSSVPKCRACTTMPLFLGPLSAPRLSASSIAQFRPLISG